MILMTGEELVWYILALCIAGPILVLLVIAGAIAMVKRFKMMKKPSSANNKDVNNKDIIINEDFIKAFGENNIIDVKMEMTRLTVTLKDIELCNAEALKEFGASGVLLVSNQVKCSFKENIEEYYNQLKGSIKND